MNPKPFNNGWALKTHNPENWIKCMPLKQAFIVQWLFKLIKNYKDYCVHHWTDFTVVIIFTMPIDPRSSSCTANWNEKNFFVFLFHMVVNKRPYLHYTSSYQLLFVTILFATTRRLQWYKRSRGQQNDSNVPVMFPSDIFIAS